MPTKFLNISTDSTLGGANAADDIVSSQKAIKTYVDNNGGSGLSSYDFTHVANTTVISPFTFTCAANQRNSQMITTNANLTLNITCNNGADNYLWIKNSSTANDIDIALGTVTYNNTALAASEIFLPSDGISVPMGNICEIGLIINSDGAFITSRNDLVESV